MARGSGRDDLSWQDRAEPGGPGSSGGVPAGGEPAGDLERILGEYVDRLNDGEVIDRARVSAEHPHLAPEILERLDLFIEVGRKPELEVALGALGDYRLLRPLGRGGMGVVYQAWQGSMDRPVALKVLPAGIAADQSSFLRFMREARTAGKLNHPNVVSVYGMGVESNTPYYSMEYVEGRTLAQVLPVPEVDLQYCLSAAGAFAGVAEGLQHAHQKGIIHRDIKPSNLILDRDGRLRILDFGLARLVGEDSLTVSGDFMGTPVYMSPEQARARRVRVDHRTDLYSLGATMYHVLAGRPPFKGADHQDTVSRIIHWDPAALRSLNPRIPRDLENIVHKCLRKEPADRYRTAEALAQDLRRFSRGDPVEARPQPAWEKLRRGFIRRKGSLLGAFAALLVLLTSGLLLEQYRAQRLERMERRYREEVLEAAMMLELGELTVKAGSDRPVAIDPQHLFHADDFQALVEETGLNPLESAVARLAGTQSLFPRRPEAHYHRARGLALLGKSGEALAELDRAVRFAPEFAPARALRRELRERSEGGRGAASPEEEPPGDAGGLGALWLEAHRAIQDERWRDGAALYGRLIRESAGGGEAYLGSSVELYLGRGKALLECGERSAAIESFVAACTLWPRAKVPQLLLGKAYYLKGEKEDAERTFQAIHAEAGPRKDEVALWVAALYKYFRGYARGLEWAEKLKQESLRLRLQVDFNTLLGRYDEAIHIGLGAIEKYPKDAFTHHALAVSLLRDPKNVRKALEVAQRAWDLDQRHADTLSLLATAHQSSGDLERAKELFRKAIELAPHEPRGHDHLGRLFWEAGDLDEAERHIRAAISIVDRKGSYHFMDSHGALGGILAARGRLEESLAAYRKGLELNPESLADCRNPGAILRRLGRLEEAEAALRQAVQLNPRDGRTLHQLGLTLLQSRREDEGVSLLRQAVLADPKFAPPACDLGWALERKGKFSEAFEAYRQGLSAQLPGRNPHQSLLDLEIREGAGGAFADEWDRVVEVLEKESEATREKLPRVLHTLAVALERGRARRDPLRAEELARRAVERSGREVPEYLATLAGIELEKGNREEAVLLLEEAVRLPQATRSHLRRLEEWRKRIFPEVVSFSSIDGLLGSSLEGSALLSALRPAGRRKDALLPYLEGRLLQRAGRPGEAAGKLAEALERGGPSPEVQLGLVECRRAEGNAPEAERLLRGALSSFRADRALWDLWMAIGLLDLARSPASMLEGLPELPGEETGPGTDCRWLLERLRSGEPIRIDCGGGEYRSASGEEWGKDRFFLGGAPRAPVKYDIAGTGDDPLFRTARWFPDEGLANAYRLPVPRGSYRVTLHFAETSLMDRYPRAMEVLLEDGRVLSAYDPARAGFSAADSRVFEVRVEDGALDIRFIPQGPGGEEAMVSALSVERVE